ncbi:MAG: helix-hairpin-helix domain-containing protein, partial [Candidatus Absconditabacteria bacterium]
IDPKAIGVGQYQHDVDQNLLQKKLDEKVEDTVNNVGVDVNTASYALLQYVAGLSKNLAKNVVDYRNENGKFESKTQIKKVKGMGPKAYEQCIGFLRIKGGKEILDMTGIHPENHKKVYEILDGEFGINKKSLKLPITIETKNSNLISEKYDIGYETLIDIFADLARPGLDPREDIPVPKFKSEVLDVKDLDVGMVLDGVIRNVTDFGAFVDIGLHNDGLVHKSEMADFFVSNPTEVVSVGMPVKVKVLTIDVQREKVGLSMKGINTLNNNQTRSSQSTHQKYEEKESNNEESSIKGNITFF